MSTSGNWEAIKGNIRFILIIFESLLTFSSVCPEEEQWSHVTFCLELKYIPEPCFVLLVNVVENV